MAIIIAPANQSSPIRRDCIGKCLYAYFFAVKRVYTPMSCMLSLNSSQADFCSHLVLFHSEFSKGVDFISETAKNVTLNMTRSLDVAQQKERHFSSSFWSSLLVNDPFPQTITSSPVAICDFLLN